MAAATTKKSVTADFCDVHSEGAEAPSFSYPELAEPAPTPSRAWRWINVWATWCAPCVAEMPLLERWRQRLGQQGKAVDLVYLSVDDDAAAVAAFRETNGVGRGPRVRAMDALTPWLTMLGLDSAASIPIHIFVDPNGKVRCVRRGALEAHHFDDVAQLVAQ
ncbi:MAG: TlpA family protein disulfide reductase [Myxococcota bacterium]